jgi:indole-3-glycerol phosphate synthase
MHIDDIKQGLRAEIKKRENEQYLTFQTNIRDMCRDVLTKLEEQEALIKEMKEAAADMGLKWHDYDACENAWEDQHKGKWINTSRTRSE